jgi:hypothetical protein
VDFHVGKEDPLPFCQEIGDPQQEEEEEEED